MDVLSPTNTPSELWIDDTILSVTFVYISSQNVKNWVDHFTVYFYDISFVAWRCSDADSSIVSPYIPASMVRFWARVQS